VDADCSSRTRSTCHPTAHPGASPNARCCRASACGVCGTVLIEDLRRDLASLPDGPRVEHRLLPGLVEQPPRGTGSVSSAPAAPRAGLFTGGRRTRPRAGGHRPHNAVDKVVGRSLIDGALPLSDSILVVSGRAGYEMCRRRSAQASRSSPPWGAPSSLAVSLAREFQPDPGRLSPR